MSCAAAAAGNDERGNDEGVVGIGIGVVDGDGRSNDGAVVVGDEGAVGSVKSATESGCESMRNRVASSFVVHHQDDQNSEADREKSHVLETTGHQTR
jgi:hypothetical protein